jgi:hypothetical protein
VLRSHRERPSMKTTYVQRRAILRVEVQTISTFWVLAMIAVISRSIFAVESVICLSHTRVKVGEAALQLASLAEVRKIRDKGGNESENGYPFVLFVART